jgi:hypothetical protein
LRPKQQGQVLGGSTIRISWGRSSTSRAAVNAAAAAASPAFALAGAAGGFGAATYGLGAFDANGYTAYGAGASTAHSDPYTAYFAAAMAQSDPSAYQVHTLAMSLVAYATDLLQCLPLGAVLLAFSDFVCKCKIRKGLGGTGSKLYTGQSCSHAL